MLIEFHMLQNHAPSNLNRDDTGSPKECLFGGTRRARISSQCLKRSIRTSDEFRAEMEGHLATRTRKLPELVRQALAGSPAGMAELAAKKATGFGTKDGRESPPHAKTGQLLTRQTMLLTQQDVNAVTEVMRSAIEKARNPQEFEKDKAYSAKELQGRAELAGYRPITVDVALFGRMVTSPAFRDVDASCQVAHAISTHNVETEYDYYTAVDDLQGAGEEEEDAGADMIGDVEFNSACYYKYFSVDVDGLVRNLAGEGVAGRRPSAEEVTGARGLAATAVEAMLRAAAMANPTGKQNTFAAHQLPSLILVEARPVKTPISYANAFVDPVRPQANSDIVSLSIKKLLDHATLLTTAFGLQTNARLLFTPVHSGFNQEGFRAVATLKALCDRVNELAGHAQGGESNG